MKELIDIMLHRVIWNGDRIRLHSHSDVLYAEDYVKVEGWGMSAPVRLTGGGAIRRDLPFWSSRFQCWVYRYGALSKDVDQELADALSKN